jgi:hypothetical protein
MKSPGLLDRIGDALNPIVVKELRQAVQSRFVVAVLLLFLLLQLVFMGIYLMIDTTRGQFESVEFQGGRTVFLILQGVLLATCMLFLPAYSGFRLGAERSDVNVDLLFISTLRPRAILSGKITAALVLALLIFSACTPFMAFTYFLRGIDLASIFFVIGLDFLVVMVTVMVALFLAVVPANRVVKVLLGLVGLFVGLMVFFWTLTGTLMLLDFGLVEGQEFWAVCLVGGLVALGTIGFLFTASVGLLSPLSANRTLPLRLWVIVYCLGSGLAMAWCCRQLGHEGPLYIWIVALSIQLSLCLWIAVNEREEWAPRLARTIPRRSLLRPVAFLSYSGAAGGVLWACLLFAVFWLALPLARPLWLTRPPDAAARDELQITFNVLSVMFVYFYCYALTAVFLRNTVIKIPPVFTWILMFVLLTVGCVFPFLFLFLFRHGVGDIWTDYPWLLTNPVAGMWVIGEPRAEDAQVVLTFVFSWAAMVTLLNGPWFVRQMRRFRPYLGSAARTGKEALPSIRSTASLDTTKTLP